MRPATAAKVLTDEFKEVLRGNFGEGAVKLSLSTEEQEQRWTEFKSFLVGALEQGHKGSPKGGKAYVMGGENPTFADMFVAGHLGWIYLVFEEESKEWQEVAGLLDGRIGKLVKDILESCGTPVEQ
ncbi:hypothetical protein L218DRAFT_886705 [Marasmius fiardii PR-910]|nr:hypothetical protein L218DRAFT_886705 [Marasmius fiardii PR-910]